MLRVDFQKLFDEEIKARWPQCKFTLITVDDWYTKFGNVYPETLRKAVKNYKIEDDTASPKMNELGKYVSKVIAETRNWDFTPTEHQVIELRCTSHKKAFKIGQVKKYYLPLDMHLSPEILRQQASGRAREHSQQYGGEWCPINLQEVL